MSLETVIKNQSRQVGSTDAVDPLNAMCLSPFGTVRYLASQSAPDDPPRSADLKPNAIAEFGTSFLCNGLPVQTYSAARLQSDG